METASLLEKANAGLYGAVCVHLTEAANDPSISLDDRLLNKCDHLFIKSLGEGDRHTLLNHLSALLSTFEHDPTPATILIESLIREPSITFTNILQIDPPVNFVVGLGIPSPPINIVTLNLLEKAAASANDAGIVAAKPEIVAGLVNVWLRTPDTAVATKSMQVLVALLRADIDALRVGEDRDLMDFRLPGTYSPHRDQGLMWRRLFNDKDIYGLLFSICSLKTLGQQGQLNRSEKTIAQARLLEFIKRFPIIRQLRTPQIPEVEEAYGVNNGGLLQFAAGHMVDYEDDVLMHLTLMEFFAEFIGLFNADLLALDSQRAAEFSPHSSEPLDFMISTRLHGRTMSYYLAPDTHSPLDSSYLMGKSAEYIAVYASNCATHLLQVAPSVAEKILTCLSRNLQQVPASKWTGSLGPKYDLHLLASLPRIMLLPRIGHDSPFFYLPAKPASADVFKVLATIFHGPLNEITLEDLAFVPPRASPGQRSVDIGKNDKAAARALYLYYLEQNPDLWKNVVAAAETVAMKESALAAIGLIEAVISANWITLPEEPSDGSNSPFRLPTERELKSRCRAYGTLLPPGGVQAILLSPVLEVVFPYLMKPAQSFTNLVGGRGDTESSAYKIAAAKHDTLVTLHVKLQGVADGTPELETGSWQELIAAVARRINQGPLGGSSEVGGRIATLDR